MGRELTAPGQRAQGITGVSEVRGRFSVRTLLTASFSCMSLCQGHRYNLCWQAASNSKLPQALVSLHWWVTHKKDLKNAFYYSTMQIRVNIRGRYIRKVLLATEQAWGRKPVLRQSVHHSQAASQMRWNPNTGTWSQVWEHMNKQVHLS